MNRPRKSMSKKLSEYQRPAILLSGSGSKLYCFISMLQVLTDLKLKDPVVISGISGGALVAAAATKWGLAGAHQGFYNNKGKPFRRSDVYKKRSLFRLRKALKTGGLYSIEPLLKRAERTFDTEKFKELSKKRRWDLKVGCVNLKTGKMEYHKPSDDYKNFHRRLVASAAVLGICEAVDRRADGGFAEVTPISSGILDYDPDLIIIGYASHWADPKGRKYEKVTGIRAFDDPYNATQIMAQWNSVKDLDLFLARNGDPGYNTYDYLIIDMPGMGKGWEFDPVILNERLKFGARRTMDILNERKP